MEKFNDSIVFEKEMAKTMLNLLKDKINSFLEYCIQTKDIEPINKMIDILTENQYKECK